MRSRSARCDRPCLQQARASERDAALDEIVRAATAPPPSKGSGLGLGPDRMHVRPLQAVDASGPKVRCWALSGVFRSARLSCYQGMSVLPGLGLKCIKVERAFSCKWMSSCSNGLCL